MGRTCIIIGASNDHLDREILEKSLDPGAERPYIYCADGGLLNASALGLKPDKLMGDMDSAGEDFVRAASGSETGQVVWLPEEKDETDLFVCVADGLKNGYKDFLLLFCTGGRLDHFMGAVSILEYLADHDAGGVVLDSRNRISFIKPGRYEVEQDDRYRYLSIIPLDDMLSGITLTGVKYPLTDAAVRRQDLSLLISNEIMGKKAMVQIGQGKALLIKSRD